ncbi:unnamed protein product [Sphagnum balticum]
MAFAAVASQGLCTSGLEKTCSSSSKLTQQLSSDSPILSAGATSIPIAKMSRESSSACNKDVHVAEPVKKKSASAACENGGVAAKC